MATEIIIIFFLLLLNGFFALSEIAVVSASKPMLRQYAKEGNRSAATALSLAENSGRFLSTVQVGITLVGILAGAYGGATIAQKLTPAFDAIKWINPHGETVAVTVIVTLLTYFSVVMGELVPKQFALTKPEKLAMAVAPIMYLLSKICTPVVYILEMSGHWLMRILRISSEQDNNVTEAEVKAIISEGAESGAIEKTEHEVLQRVIRLGDRDVKSIMTHRTGIVFIDLKDSLDVIRRKIHEAGHSHYPVTDGNTDKVIGIVRAKDMLDAALSHSRLQLQDHLLEIPSVSDTTSCLDLLELFKKSKLHIAIIVDEYGITEGIVTTSDILEAIIGALPSNYEGEHPFIAKRDETSWLVDGLTPIHEIHLSLGLEDIKIDPAYDTIAGFLLQNFSKAPQEGDAFEEFGYRFEVMDMDGRRIDKILISQLDTNKNSESN